MLETAVSVVIPCYNVEACVERAVKSVLAQTQAVQEVICVDDGSTDGTRDVLRRLEATHSEVRVLTGPNRGAPAARNRGLKASSGTYIQFLDADDSLDPEKIAEQVGVAEASRADLVVGSYRRVLEDGSVTIFLAKEGDVWEQLVASKLGITSANLWRRVAVESVKGWNEEWKSSQEYELMLRMLQHGAQVSYTPELKTTLYERSNSISSNFAKAAPQRRYTEVRVRALEYLRAEDLLAGRTDTVQEVVFKRIRHLYVVDSSAARALYRRAFPDGFVPRVSGFNTRGYVAAYRLLGLRGAEALRHLLGKG